MIGRTGFVGDLDLQRRRVGLHLPDHRPLGLGSGRLARHDGQRGQLPRRRSAWASTTSPARRSCTAIGGFVALAGAIVLGPRLGRRFKRDGGGPMLPHDLTMATVGGFILWFGWYGFNPGSTLSAMDFEGIGRVAANTTLAACAAGLDGDVLRLSEDEDVGRELHGQRLPRRPRRDHLPLLLGVADRRDPARRHRRRDRGAWRVDLLEYLRIDDPIGAVPVHGICGIWGTLSLGLFACGQYGVDRARWRPTTRRRSRASSTAAASPC